MVEPKRLIRTIIQINENFYSARQQIIDEHPNFDKINDSRIALSNNKVKIWSCFFASSWNLAYIFSMHNYFLF